MEERTIYDVVIIGSGPGGMTAALYTSRANLKTLILEKGVPGGELLNTSDVENYPGFPTISGPELADNMYKGAMQFGAEYAYGQVSKIELEGDLKVITAGKKTYYAYAVVIATGSYHRKLEVPGEEEYAGRGVSYCAVCDGAFFRDQDLLVVGGGDSAVEEAIFLTRFAKSVTIVHRRDELRAQKVLQDRAFANEKINFIWDSVVKEIKGENRVESVVIENVKTGQVTEQAFGGVFIYVGLDPVSDFVQELQIRDEAGWIVTDDHMKTSVTGVFAVGDVRQKDLRQVTTAVGDGAIAGQEAYKYITEHY